MIAVTVAGLVLGAGAGTAITLVAHDGSDRNGHHLRMDRDGFPGERRGGGDGQRGPGSPNLAPPNSDNLPPGTAPREQDDDSDSGQDGPNDSDSSAG